MVAFHLFSFRHSAHDIRGIQQRNNMNWHTRKGKSSQHEANIGQNIVQNESTISRITRIYFTNLFQDCGNTFFRKKIRTLFISLIFHRKLNRKSFATTITTSFHDLATSGGCHTVQKAMLSSAFLFLWLPCTFHRSGIIALSESF